MVQGRVWNLFQSWENPSRENRNNFSLIPLKLVPHLKPDTMCKCKRLNKIRIRPPGFATLSLPMVISDLEPVFTEYCQFHLLLPEAGRTTSRAACEAHRHINPDIAVQSTMEINVPLSQGDPQYTKLSAECRRDHPSTTALLHGGTGRVPVSFSLMISQHSSKPGCVPLYFLII